MAYLSVNQKALVKGDEGDFKVPQEEIEKMKIQRLFVKDSTVSVKRWAFFLLLLSALVLNEYTNIEYDFFFQKPIPDSEPRPPQRAPLPL